MKKSTLIGLIFIGGAIGFYFFSYWNKGGFNSTTIEIRGETNIELIGLEYNGPVKNPKFGSYFDEVEDAIEDKKTNGLYANSIYPRIFCCNKLKFKFL